MLISGGNEIAEEALREGVARHAFGVPLDADDPAGAAGPFDSFDGAVGGMARDCKIFAGLVDGLVVRAIDLGFRLAEDFRSLLD